MDVHPPSGTHFVVLKSSRTAAMSTVLQEERSRGGRDGGCDECDGYNHNYIFFFVYAVDVGVVE